jgi:hypothetical protein
MALSEREELEYLALLEAEEADRVRDLPIWSPKDPEFPDIYTPQMALVESDADIIFFGGGVGSGKTFAVACLALTQSESTLILRREFSQHEEIVNVFTKLVGAENIVGGTLIKWRDESKKNKTIRAKRIRLGHLQHPEKDWQKYQGLQFGQVIIDEATAFPEKIIRLLMAWNRKPAEFKNGKIVHKKIDKIKTIFTFNPPITHEGLWILKPIAPWEDENFRDHHGKPMRPKYGEILHVLNLDNEEYFFWEHTETDIHPVTGKPLGMVFTTVSRTFIKATLKDNAYLRNDPVYIAKLQAMPPEWRKAMLEGDMSAQLVDQINQIFKGDALKECQARWRAINDSGNAPITMPLAIGLDTAQGGDDDNVYFPIWERGYIGQKGMINGRNASDATKLCDWLEAQFYERWRAMPDEIPICVDAIGGRDFAHEWRRRHPTSILHEFKGSNSAGVMGIFKTKVPKENEVSKEERQHNAAADMPFYSIGVNFSTKISGAYIRMGDATRHPDFAIALPPDNELIRQLAARTAKPDQNRMGISPKEQFIKDFGKSPNEADAAVMAYWFIDVVLKFGLTKAEIARFEDIQRVRCS